MLEVLQDSTLKNIELIDHGFFTRQGGVSTGWYESLNCAYASDDNPDNVRENRRRAMSHFNFSLESLVSVHNVHSNHAIIIEQPMLKHLRPHADAMVTKLSQIVLGSDSADCPIILFADSIAGVIGLAHAGWRGSKSGIIEATVEKMIFLGAKPEHIQAAISPCITKKSYEVSMEFYQEFLDENAQNKEFFTNSIKLNHFYFDLLSYVKSRLNALNLKSVSSEVSFDTYSDERFYSCRRATHRGETSFGGQLSCIYIK